MTVVPGTANGRFNLICDRCGDIQLDAVGSLLDTDVVWPLLTEQNWTGSPFATGPHQCPDCATAEPTPPAPSVPDSADDRGSSPFCRVETADLDTAVVTVHGTIDYSGAEPVRDALAHAIALHRNIIVDMAAVPTIDPTGLSVLVHAHQDAKQRGGLLCLAAPSRVIRTVLHTMRLDRVFLTFDDRADAFARLAWARTPPDDAFRPGGPILFDVKEHDVITPWSSSDDSANPYLSDQSHPADERTPLASVDQRLAVRLAEQLRLDERTSQQHITVAVQNRVAILSGWVDSDEAVDIATGHAWRLAGIIDVCNVLQHSEQDDWP